MAGYVTHNYVFVSKGFSSNQLLGLSCAILSIECSQVSQGKHMPGI